MLRVQDRHPPAVHAVLGRRAHLRARVRHAARTHERLREDYDGDDIDDDVLVVSTIVTATLMRMIMMIVVR